MKRLQTLDIVIIFFIAITLNLNAQVNGRESYVDIPRAHFSEGLFLNIDGSYPIGSEDEVKTDINGGIEISINQFNAVLNWYSGTDFALNLSYLILKQVGMVPSLSLGIDNLTYRKFISPVGHGHDSTFSDEEYIPRPPEIASAYLVATRTFNEYFELTAGVGRGRFIGYGPRSHLLNFDVFFDEEHEDYVFGLFGGAKFSVPGGAAFIIETDGRDANIGIQYQTGMFKGTLGLNKLELFTSEEGSGLAPRVSASVSVQGMSFEKPRPGQVNILLADEDTGEPIPGALICGNGKKIRVEIPYSGKKTVTLDAGVYLFILNSSGYKEKQAKVPIRPNQVLNLNVKLRKKLTPNMISSIELTRKAAKNYKNGNLKDAQKEFSTALKLYPENKKAKKGLNLVENAIQDTIGTLKIKAKSLESTDLRGAIALWQEVLDWKYSEEVNKHLQVLNSRLTGPQKKPKTTTKAKITEKKPSLSKAEISNLYKKGIKAYIQGNYKEAARYFRSILRVDPNHKGAKRYLKKATEKL